MTVNVEVTISEISFYSIAATSHDQQLPGKFAHFDLMTMVLNSSTVLRLRYCMSFISHPLLWTPNIAISKSVGSCVGTKKMTGVISREPLFLGKMDEER